ncbi:MAG: hypothetical protein QM489_02145 [Candidatus Izemoplasma sp.]
MKIMIDTWERIIDAIADAFTGIAISDFIPEECLNFLIDNKIDLVGLSHLYLDSKWLQKIIELDSSIWEAKYNLKRSKVLELMKHAVFMGFKRQLNLIILSFSTLENKRVAIHVQCFMRISKNGIVYTSTNEIYKQDDIIIDTDFDWTIPFTTRFDDLVNSDNLSWNLRVNFVELSNTGFKIHLDGEIVIEILSESSEEENYRVFVLNEDNHYVY